MSQLFPGQMKTALGSQATLQILFNTCFLVHLKFSVPQTLIWCQALGWYGAGGPQTDSCGSETAGAASRAGGVIVQQRTPCTSWSHHLPELAELSRISTWQLCVERSSLPAGTQLIFKGWRCCQERTSLQVELHPGLGRGEQLSCVDQPSRGSAFHLLLGISLWELRFPELSGGT